MDEKVLEKIGEAITTLAAEVKALKDWRNAQEVAAKEAEEEQRFAQAEFEKFIAERRAAESKRAADEAKLREKMV